MKNEFIIPFYPNMTFAFRTHTYAENKNTFIGLLCEEDGFVEPYCNLTVNLSVPLDKDKAFIDVNNIEARLIQYLSENDFISNTGYTKQSGYVLYPLYQLNLEKIKQHLAYYKGEVPWKNNTHIS